MTVYFSGYVFQDDGDALNGATVQLLQVSDAAEEASTTTNSDGFWSFNEADEDQYDVKITSGTSVRYRKWADEISLKMIDVRNNEGNTVPAAVFANHTNNADNDIVHYRGLRGTGADNDEMFFRYYMDDASSNTTEVARMTVKLISASAASEDSEIRWGVAVGGSIVDVFTISNTSGGATDMTMDVAGDINLDADGGDVFFKDGGTTFGSATNNSGDLIIKSGTTAAATFTGANVLFAGTVDATTDFTIGTTVITDDVITFTPTASDTVTMTATTNGAFSLVTVDDAAAAANIQITADGTVDIDSAGVLTLDSGAAINIEPATGSAVLIDGTVSIDGGAITGVASILEADVKIGEDDQTKIDFETADEIHFYAGNENQLTLTDGALTPSTNNIVDLGTDALEFKDAYFDGTLEADAITIAGTNIVTGSVITTLGTISSGTWEATDVGVAHGGTGVSTLTDGGVLLGSGASAITAMAVLADGEMIVGDGTTDPVAESGATLRTSIGVGTGDSPQFTDLTLTDDLTLNSDSAVFNMGADNDFTITHDGTTGATLAGNPITITSAGAATWSTSSGALTLTSAAAATWSTAAGALTIDGDDGIVLQTSGSGHITTAENIQSTSNTQDASIATAYANYGLVFRAAQTTHEYSNSIGWSEGTNVAAAISGVDDGAGGAQGLSFATGTNSALTERVKIHSSGVFEANGGAVFNEGSSDVDFRIESNGATHSFMLNGGTGHIGLGGSDHDSVHAYLNGTAASGSAAGLQISDTLDPSGNSIAANLWVAGTIGEHSDGATTHPIFASAYFAKPTITGAGATLTNASTVYIKDAPSEGETSNYALWVDAGATRFDGTVTVNNTFYVDSGTTNTIAKFESSNADGYVHFLDGDSDVNYPPGFYVDGNLLHLRGGTSTAWGSQHMTLNAAGDVGINMNLSGTDYTKSALHAAEVTSLEGELSLGYQNSNEKAKIDVVSTADVSTSATTIYTATRFAGIRVGIMLLVAGLKDGSSSIAFTDLIVVAPGGSETTVNVVSTSNSSSADARTYSMAADAIKVAMAANTYDINVMAFRMGSTD